MNIFRRRKPILVSTDFVQQSRQIRADQGAQAWMQWMLNQGGDDWLWNLRHPTSRGPSGSEGSELADRIPLDQEGGAETLCLLSTDYDGYTREAAVRRMREIPVDLAMPMLLFRLNDWVPEIRQTARAVVEELWPRAFTDREGQTLLLDLLPSFWRFSQAKREDPSWLMQRLWKVLAKDDANILLQTACTRVGSKTRRWAIIGLFTSGFRPLSLDPWLQHPDPVLRLRILRLLHRELGEETLLATLEGLSQSKAAFLRKASLYLWVELFPEQSKPKLIKALTDPSTGIRSTARFYLHKQGFDLSGYLRDLVQRTESSPNAWLAFADVAGHEDRDLMESQLTSGQSQSRLAAYRYCLRQEDPDERILDGLCDSSPRVARQMQKACLKARRSLSIPSLLHRMQADLPPSYRRRMLRILDQQSPIHCLVELLSRERTTAISPRDLQHITDLLTRLSRRVFTTPDSEVLDLLEQRLIDPPIGIPYTAIEDLGRMLHSWRKARI